MRAGEKSCIFVQIFLGSAPVSDGMPIVMDKIKLPKAAPKWVREASPEKQAEWLEEYRAKRREYMRKRYQANLERAREKSRKWYKANLERVREYMREYMRKRRKAQREDRNCLAFFQAMNEMAEINKALSKLEQNKNNKTQ